MRTGVIAAVIAVLILVGGAFALLKNSDKKSDSAPTSTNTTQTPPSTTTETQNTEQQATNTENTSASTITYTNNGFSPSTVTVKAGTKITVKNESARLLQFSSDPHPEHTDEDELNMGTISPGKSDTFTVNATGKHGFHNHLNESHTGTLTVE